MIAAKELPHSVPAEEPSLAGLLPQQPLPARGGDGDWPKGLVGSAIRRVKGLAGKGLVGSAIERQA